ncbi:MAG: DUF4900 domain-containing protein [bacterium]|nr:DUF4900 domain-containing protein [bacterium]
MSTLLLAACLAYLKWQTTSYYSSHHQIAEIQAYYTAQAAIIQIPLQHLRASDLRNLQTPAVIAFNDGEIPNMGKYENVRIQKVFDKRFDNWKSEFVCAATGIATFATGNSRLTEVKRRVYCRVKVNYGGLNRIMWMNDIEQTRFGEFIWFFSGDTIEGRFHSNSDIGVHSGAVFRGFVTTVGRILTPNGSIFSAYPPPGYREHYPHQHYPFQYISIRESAVNTGIWLDREGSNYIHGLQIVGNQANVWKWQTGSDSPYGEIDRITQTISWNPDVPFAIFCTGDLWIKGFVRGNLGIGAEGNLRIMDNIVYEDAQNYPYTVPETSPNFLTLVSHAHEPVMRTDPWTGVLIANTWENGREDGGNHFPIGTNQNRRDIAIHAFIIVLNSSFTFQQHNDNEGYEPYVYSCPEHQQDLRGYLYFTGGLIQHRRGYFHRGNTETTGIRTGFYRVLKYDRRFNDVNPPFTNFPMDSTDRMFSVIGWYDDPRAAFQTNRRNTYELGDPPIRE